MVASAQIIDGEIILGGNLAYWSVNKNDIVNISLEGKGTPLGGTKKDKVTITGLKRGRAIVTVQYYDALAQCIVDVSNY